MATPPNIAPSVYVENSTGGGGGGGTTATPSVGQLQDATTTAKQNVIPQGDGTSNTQNGGVSTSLNYVYNGTNWDRARGNATQGTLVYGNFGTTLNTGSAVTNPSATTTDSVVLAANATRKRVLIYNTSTTATVYIKYGSAATATSFNWAIPPSANGASYLSITAEFLLLSDIHALSSAGTASLVITEFTG